MSSPYSPTEATLIALDRAYLKAAGRMLLQIQAITNAPGSQLQRALKELDDEADRLAAADERMKADNAALLKALGAQEDAFVAAQTLIVASDNDIQAGGQTLAIAAVTAKVFLGFTQRLAQTTQIDPLSPQALALYIAETKRAGVIWNVPTVLDFATNYVDSPAWIARMEAWGTGYAKITRDTLLEGVQSGWGPKYTAAQLRHVATALPKRAAETLTRTLQVTAYRDASAAMELMNGQYIVKKIRVSALKPTSCLSCIALHGTELAPGERVDDHYRGYCSEFYVVPGGPEHPDSMQADSLPGKRNFTKWQTGPEWFASLPEARQKQQASFVHSPAKWRAFKAGTPLQSFVGEHQDEVFGKQVVEASLKQAIGETEAEGFYTVNQ
jgi:hypothetical protein